MHVEPMEEIVKSMRSLRDPKKHQFVGGPYEPVLTQGFVATDRV